MRERRGPGQGWAGAPPRQALGSRRAGASPARQQPEPGVSRHISGIYSYFGLFILLTSTFK